MLQFTWERGLLDLDRFFVEDFTGKEKLDGMVNIISNTSISQLLTNCSEVFEEKYLLQLNMKFIVSE